MTGEQFLNWLEGVKKIEAVKWAVAGDPLNADEVNVLITADGEQISVSFGSPKNGDRPNDFQKAILCMIANRVINGPKFNVGCDPADVVNFTRRVIGAD